VAIESFKIMILYQIKINNKIKLQLENNRRISLLHQMDNQNQNNHLRQMMEQMVINKILQRGRHGKNHNQRILIQMRISQQSDALSHLEIY